MCYVCVCGACAQLLSTLLPSHFFFHPCSEHMAFFFGGKKCCTHAHAYTFIPVFVWARVRTHAHFFDGVRPLYCAHKLQPIGLFAICVNYSAVYGSVLRTNIHNRTRPLKFLDKHNKIIITHPQSICICSVTICVNKVEKKKLFVQRHYIFVAFFFSFYSLVCAFLSIYMSVCRIMRLPLKSTQLYRWCVSSSLPPLTSATFSVFFAYFHSSTQNMR